VIDEVMSKEKGSMFTRKMKLGGKKLVPGPILHHNFHKDRTGIEFRLPLLEVEK
jgi:hypothetical protein